MKKFLLIFSALILVLTSCGKEEFTAEIVEDEGEKPEKVSFVLDWTPNTNHTGIYVAKALGYYKDEGIELEINQPPEDGAEVLVASGKADIGVSFQDMMAQALVGENKLPITAVCALLQHNTSGIVSLKGSGIDRPKGMEGHTYATWDWDIEKAILKNVVERDGGDFSKVKLVPSTVTDEVSALKTKMADSIWIYYAWAGVACEVAGLPIDYFAFRDINPVFDYYTPVLIASDNFIKERPEVLKAFLRATEKGYKYAIDNPEEAAKILIDADPALKDSEELVLKSQEWINKEYIADSERWGYIEPKRWNDFFKFLSDNGLIEEIPENTGFTDDFLP